MNIYIYKSQLEIKEKKRKFIKPNIQIGKKKTYPLPLLFLWGWEAYLQTTLRQNIIFKEKQFTLAWGIKGDRKGRFDGLWSLKMLWLLLFCFKGTLYPPPPSKSMSIAVTLNQSPPPTHPLFISISVMRSGCPCELKHFNLSWSKWNADPLGFIADFLHSLLIENNNKHTFIILFYFCKYSPNRKEREWERIPTLVEISKLFRLVSSTWFLNCLQKKKSSF